MFSVKIEIVSFFLNDFVDVHFSKELCNFGVKIHISHASDDFEKF